MRYDESTRTLYLHQTDFDHVAEDIDTCHDGDPLSEQFIRSLCNEAAMHGYEGVTIDKIVLEFHHSIIVR